MDSAAVWRCSGRGFLAGPAFTDSTGEWGEGAGVWEKLEQAGSGHLPPPAGFTRTLSPLYFLPIALRGGEWASFITGDGNEVGGPLPCAPTCPREEHLRHPLAKPPAPEGQVGRAALGRKGAGLSPAAARSTAGRGLVRGGGGAQEEGEGKKGALRGGPFAPCEPVNATGSPTLDTHLSR